MNAQSSLEFMFYTSVLMLIMSLFLWSNASIQERFVSIKTVDEAKKVCDSIAFEIDTAVRAGDGYSREFYVEENFFGVSDFDVFVTNYVVTVDWGEGAVSSKIITENITGSVNKGWNLIRNVNGEIHVSSA
jgi:hypothetical protein